MVPTKSEWCDTVNREFAILQNRYNGLELKIIGNSATIAGPLRFSATHDGARIEEEFDIEIEIPPDYPNDVPLTRETGGRIPDDYHKNPGGSLCLGVRYDLKERMRGEPGLKNYVEKLVIPYFFRYAAIAQTGQAPFDDLPHGHEGVMVHYKEKFGGGSPEQVYNLLSCLVEGEWRGHHPCPCGSGKLTRKCHQSHLMNCQAVMTQRDLAEDLLQCFAHLRSINISVPRPSRKLRKVLEKLEVLREKNTRH
jgi:hypothetical protein